MSKFLADSASAYVGFEAGQAVTEQTPVNTGNPIVDGLVIPVVTSIIVPFIKDALSALLKRMSEKRKCRKERKERERSTN